MIELLTSIAARVMALLAKSVGSPLARLREERKAALRGSSEPTDQMDAILRETLSRLQGGQVESKWWETLANRLGQSYIAPDYFNKPALQKWLSIEEVENGLLEIASAHVMGTTAGDETDIRKELGEHYERVTGELGTRSRGPIDTVVAVLSASFDAATPRDFRTTTAMIQRVGKEVSQSKARRDERLLESRKDPLVQSTHTSNAERVLDEILKYRLLDIENARQGVVALFAQIEEGAELAYATEDAKNKVRYWTARLCADSQESLQTAIDVRAGLNEDHVDRPLYVIDALIAASSEDRGRAMQIVRGLDESDARTVMFKLLAQFDGSHTALTWSKDLVVGDLASCFTHAGWKNWAFHMSESGRWEDAAEKLIEVESHMGLEPGVALIEGTINAVLILPEELRDKVPGNVPLYFGIGPNMDSKVEKYRKRAIYCFDYLATSVENITNDNLREIVEDWRVWLRLMSPNILEAQQAQSELRGRLELSESEVDLVAFAWAFGFSFDHKFLQDRLRLHRRLGGLNDREMVAECLSNAMTLESRQFVNYWEDNSERLDRVMLESTMTVMLVEALASDGQFDRARELVATRAELLDSPSIKRVDIVLGNDQSKDRRSELENLYKETESIVDLNNLIAYLESVGDRAELEQCLNELFKKAPSSKNAQRLVNFLCRRVKDHASVLSFFDEYPLLPTQHAEFKSAQAWAKFHSGRIRESKKENDDLLASRKSVNDLVLDIRLGIVSGEWDRLLAIVDREWANRHDLEPGILLLLAQIAAQRGKSPERALELAKTAVIKAPEDPWILISAYNLHFFLGCENQADPKWLTLALEHSSDDGPVWSSDIKELVENQIPALRETNERLDQLLLAGKLPLELFAEMLNVTLSRILLSEHRPGLNPEDGRRRPVIPTVSALRNTVEIHDNWTIGLDITSLLVLDRLGLLQIAIDNLKELKITPETMFCLFKERSAVQFHQPARIRQAEQLRGLIDRGLIKVIEGSRAPDSASVDEFGNERAILLTECQDNGGTLVCSIPLQKAGSLTLEDADISGFEQLLVSTVDFLAIAHRTGLIDSESHARATCILANRNQTPSSEIRHSVVKGPVYLDQSALSYLQHVQVLEALAGGQIDLRIHKSIQDEANALVGTDVESDALASRIENLVSLLRSGLERGAVEVLPMLTDTGERDANSPLAADSLEELISASDGCDALCVDDQFFNKFPACTSPTGTVVPVLCVLDLLRHFRSRQVLDDVEYWNARHKLRESGFLFIPFEVDELLHWLKETVVNNDAIMETVELRAVRQSLCGLELIQISGEEELNEYISQVHMASLLAIRELWENSSVDTDTVKELSRWTWKNLVVTTCFPLTRGSRIASEDSYAQFASLVGSLLLPLAKSTLERRGAYRTWLERTIVDPMKPANGCLLERAVSIAYSACEKLEEQHRGFLLLLFEFLPDALKSLLLKRHPGFVEEYGVTVSTVIGFGPTLRMLESNLVQAAKKVFEGKRVGEQSDLNGETFSLELNGTGDLLSITWEDCQLGTQSFEIPELSLMSSDSSVRHSVSQRVLEQFGPTANVPFDVLEKSARGPLSAEDMSTVFREVTQGVATIHARLADKVKKQSLTLNDIVPDSLEYWEKFCGPPLDESDTEEWISNVLVPYRQKLLKKDLRRGLETCCIGAIRDDLSPGSWIEYISDEEVWTALQTLKIQGNPIASLGALDVALYRCHDRRFQAFAQEIILKLLDGWASVEEKNDGHRLYQILCDLVLNRIPLIEGASNLPSSWRRMCAWMQAGLVVSSFYDSNTPFDVEQVEGWTGQLTSAEGELRRLVDILQEPLVLGGVVGSRILHYAALQRLNLLKQRHENAGRKVPRGLEIDSALKKLPELVRVEVISHPNPLELHIKAPKPMTQDITEYVASSWREEEMIQATAVAAWASQSFDIGDQNLDNVRCALEELTNGIEDADLEDALLQLNSASIVAASTGDFHIAELVGVLIEKIAGSACKPEYVAGMVGVLLQAAGARKSLEEWQTWLDERFTAVAKALPSMPNECLQLFLTQMECLEIVVPFRYWFHVRAKRIATAGLWNSP